MGQFRSATLSNFPHLYNLGHHMSAFCMMLKLLSDQSIETHNFRIFPVNLCVKGLTTLYDSGHIFGSNWINEDNILLSSIV